MTGADIVVVNLAALDRAVYLLVDEAIAIVGGCLAIAVQGSLAHALVTAKAALAVAHAGDGVAVAVAAARVGDSAGAL